MVEAIRMLCAAIVVRSSWRSNIVSPILGSVVGCGRFYVCGGELVFRITRSSVFLVAACRLNTTYSFALAEMHLSACQTTGQCLGLL